MKEVTPPTSSPADRKKAMMVEAVSRWTGWTCLRGGERRETGVLSWALVGL